MVQRKKRKSFVEYCPDEIIEKINLTDDEKEMAKLHYIEGMSWSEGYNETDEYMDFDESSMDDEEV